MDTKTGEKGGVGNFEKKHMLSCHHSHHDMCTRKKPRNSMSTSFNLHKSLQGRSFAANTASWLQTRCPASCTVRPNPRYENGTVSRKLHATRSLFTNHESLPALHPCVSRCRKGLRANRAPVREDAVISESFADVARKSCANATSAHRTASSATIAFVRYA